MMNRYYCTNKNYNRLRKNEVKSMFKRVHPTITVSDRTTSFQANSSNLKINSTFLHEDYTVSRCFKCKTSGNSALMSVCDCDDKLFHQDCLKQYLQDRVSTSDSSIKSEDDLSLLKCDQCQYEIRFKINSKCRAKSFNELQMYCSRHKALTFVIGLTITLLLACTTFILLFQLGILSLSTDSIEKQVVLIALYVVSGLLLIVTGCCFLDCLRTQDKIVSTMYNRDGKSHRSSRSRMSGYHKTTKKRQLAVEQIN